MTRTIVMALAGLSIVAGSQALAQGRGNGRLGNGVPAGAVVRGGPAIVDLGIGVRSQGRLHASDRALLRANSRSALRRDLDDDVDVRSQARARSRGPDHASDRALTRANVRSVLRNRTIVRGARRPHR